ncbi:MAG: hypothetical protein QME32_04070, partial [Endomicrobiia bacterium]|nr:hypothetical protein [Endomicrobiia bacterium]
RVWSSTAASWSVGPTIFTLTGLTGAVNFLRLEPQPGSNRIMLAALDANSDIFTAVWDGDTNQFLSISTYVPTLTASIATKECFDLAWETQNGRGMILYGVGAASNYSLWSSTANQWVVQGAAGPTHTAQNTRAWLALAADPRSNSNYIGMTSIDNAATPDWNVSVWNGTVWGACPAADTSVETNVARSADVAWEKDSGRCMVVAGDLNAREISFIAWTEANGWHDPTTVGATTPSVAPKTSAGVLGLLGDINWLGLVSDPNTNQLICYAIDQAADLTSINWGGSNWSVKAIHETTVTDAARECAALALDKHDRIPPYAVDNQSGDDVWRVSNTGNYSVQFHDAGGSFLNKFQIRATVGASVSSTLILDWTDNMTFDGAVNSYSTPWAFSTGVWNGLREGLNYVHVKIFDGAFNTAVESNLFYVRKDTTSPTVPTLLSPSDGAATNNAQPPFDWTDSSDATSGVSNYEFEISTDVNFGVFTDAAAPTTSYHLPSSVYPSALYYWRARARDNAGNYSLFTIHYSLIVDTAPPSAANNVSGDFVWRASSGTNYDVRFYDTLSKLATGYYRVWTSTGQTGTRIFDWTPINTLLINATFYETPWSVNASSWALLINGTNYVTLRVDDLAGNTSTWADAFFIRKDVVSPEIPTLSAPLNGTATNQMDITFQWSTVTDAHSGIDGYELQISTSSDFSPINRATTTPSTVYLSTPLPHNIYYWRVRARDNALNYSAFSSTYSILVDTSPPSAPSLLTPSSGTITNNRQPPFDWGDSADAGSGISNYEFEISTDINFGALSDNAFPTTSYYSPPAALDSALYHWRARARDNAGNYSLFTIHYSLIVDTAPPTIINNESASSATWLNAPKPVGHDVDFEDPGLAKINDIQYKVHPAANESGTALIAWETIKSTFSPYAASFSPPLGLLSYTTNFGVNFDLLADGTNFVSVRASDLAGNTSTWIDAFKILKDVIRPTINNQQSGDFAWRNSSGTTYGVQFNDTGGSLLSRFEVRAGTSPATTTPIFDWTDRITGVNEPSYTAPWSLTASQFAALYDGATNFVSVRVFDLAGNTSTYPDAFFILKDTTPPHCVNNENTDRGWLTVNPGPVWNIDFYERVLAERNPGASRLNNLFYRAKSSTGGVIVDWSAIATSLNTTFYLDNFAVNFDVLPAGENSVDVRAIDFALNATTYINAFYVKKDTSSPRVEVVFDTATVNWINSSGFYDVNFYTQGPNPLDTVQYAVYTAPVFGGEVKIPWANIGTPPLNLASYVSDWSVNFPLLQNGGTNYVSVRAWCVSGGTATVADAFRIFKDVSLPSIVDPVPGDDTVWRSSNAAVYNVDFFDIPSDGARLDKFRLKITSASFQTGTLRQDWTDEKLNIGTTFYTADWPVKWETWLAMKEGYNYVSAKVYDNALNSFELSDVFFVLKDTTPPSIDNQQSGDTAWRRVNNGSYNVNFADSGGSKLSRFEISASTSPSGTPQLAAWTTVQAAINADSFAGPWPLPASAWTALDSRATNYIFVRVFDGSAPGNSSSTASAAFYVLKDTVPPTITNSETVERGWFRENPGAVWNVDFNDPFAHNSKLHTAQWTAYTGANRTGAQSVGWTDIFSGLGIASYAADWDIGASTFSILPSSVSFITVRSWDVAGTTTTLVDAFKIKKDTSGPTIIDNQPGYDGWLAANPGAVWNVDFRDELSRLASAYYIIYPTANLSGAPLTALTTIFVGIAQITYDADFGFPSEHFQLLSEGTSYVTVTAYDNLGNQTTSYDVFYVRKDTSPPYCVDNQNDIFVDAQSDLADMKVAFFDDGGSKINYLRYTVRPSPALPPEYIIDWANIPGIADGLNATYYASAWSLTSIFANLPNQATSYVSVRCVDFAGLATTYIDAFAIYKDASGPTIGDNVDETSLPWFNTLADVNFDVDFYSNSGQALNYFEIKITTGSYGTGQIIADWHKIADILAISYTDDWSISENDFNAMEQGYNYVHARVFDLVPTSATLNNIFYIKKDTAPPTIEDLQTDATFYFAAAEKTYDVNFYDYGIGVSSAQYLVSYSSLNPLATILVGWTNIFVGSPVSSYIADWQLNFAALQEWATNYVSVRAYDGLGYAATSYAVFSVWKDTTPPAAVSLVSPASATITTNQTADFLWAASTDATSGVKDYELQISTNPDFSWLQYSSFTAALSLNAQLADSSTYWWRARARDNAGNLSAPSGAYSLLVDTIPPAIPSLLSPADNATTNQISINFAWSASVDVGPSGISGYEFYISTASDFSVFTSSAFNFSASLPLYLSTNLYYWRVRAKDSAGNYSLF